MVQIQELQDKVSALNEENEFLRSGYSEQLCIFPRSQSTHEYSESKRND